VLVSLERTSEKEVFHEEHKTILTIKCSGCDRWNRVPASKIFIEQNTFDSKVKAYVRIYDSLEVVECKKCGRVITEPEEIIRIITKSQ